MSFIFGDYYKMIFDRKLDEAINYRKINMPKKIYKYVSLSDDNICTKDGQVCSTNKDLNELKFKALSNNQIWLSRFRYLNDPYEYKAMYLKKEELADKGWPLDILDNYINRTKSIYQIASFTTNLVDNMPMWAHYSNNHRGYCIEYDVLNAKMLYPISYEEERFGIASIITNIFNLVDKIETGTIDMDDEDYQFYMTLIIHFGLIKHATWKYENEYRILHADLDIEKVGSLVSTVEIGLYISGIYIGSQCSLAHRGILSKIAKDIGVKVYEMYLDDNVPNYSLSYRLV